MNESELLKPCPVGDEYSIINGIEVHQALKVILNIGTSQMEETISGLPAHAQMLLALLCTLGEALDNWMMIPVDDLMKYCFEAEREGYFFSFSSRQFWELIELLEDSGLISPSDLHNYYHEKEDCRFIKVGRNQFEIASVLKNITSEYRPFLDRIARYVKANPYIYEEMMEGDY
jgi:Cdc6-like AAA superfamily ATPase